MCFCSLITHFFLLLNNIPLYSLLKSVYPFTIHFFFNMIDLFGYILPFFFLVVLHVETLIPLLGIEPMSPALEAWSLNHWTTREVSSLLHFIRNETEEPESKVSNSRSQS